MVCVPYDSVIRIVMYAMLYTKLDYAHVVNLESRLMNIFYSHF